MVNRADRERLEREAEEKRLADLEEAKVPSSTTTKCGACNGTGSVPENLIGDKVDKWKDCPACGATGFMPTDDPNRCKECNGARRIPTSFVDGKPVTFGPCPACKDKVVEPANEVDDFGNDV